VKTNTLLVSGLKNQFNQCFEDFKNLSIAAKFVKSLLTETNSEKKKLISFSGRFKVDSAAVDMEPIFFQSNFSLNHSVQAMKEFNIFS